MAKITDAVDGVLRQWPVATLALIALAILLGAVLRTTL
jgi:hypothetical protein